MASFIEEIAGGKLPPVNKKTILIVGGVAIAAFVLFQTLRKPASSTVETSAPVVIADKGMPTNSADVQAQMQNFASMTEDYVNQSLSQAMNAINAENTAAANALNQKLAESLKQQQDAANALAGGVNQSLTELYNNNQQFSQSVQQSLSSQLNSIVSDYDSRFEDLNKSYSAPSPVYTPPKPSAPVSTTSQLKTGTFGNAAAAQKIADDLSKSYGAGNAKVVNENGKYRVVADFADASRAQAVGNRLTDRGLVKTYYA